MSELQTLNEKQVKHYFDYLLPILITKFNTKAEELRKLAESSVNDFLEHEEVIKLKQEHAKKVELANKGIELTKLVKEINENWYISCTDWKYDVVTTEEKLKELLEAQKSEIDNLLIELAKKHLNVNDTWTRRECMTSEIRARLSMFQVVDFDTICNGVLNTINIENYFNYPINNE